MAECFKVIKRPRYAEKHLWTNSEADGLPQEKTTPDSTPQLSCFCGEYYLHILWGPLVATEYCLNAMAHLSIDGDDIHYFMTIV